MNEKPSHLDLFSGVGGFALAAAWAGFRTVAFCEIEPHCQKVLKARFNATDADTLGQRRRETRQRSERSAERPDGIRPTLYPDIRKLSGARFAVHLLTAGVPCQPASQAGKRRGAKDDRWLWPQAIRVLSETKPAWAVFENPYGILTLEGGLVFESLLSEMERFGYEVAPPIIIPACGVGAGHLRKRVFIVAHLKCGERSQRLHDGRVRREQQSVQTVDSHTSSARPLPSSQARIHRGKESSGAWNGQPERRAWNDAHAGSAGLSQSECAKLPGPDGHDEGRTTPEFCRPETDFGLLRAIHGVPRELDRRARIHALGNSVIPAQVYPILKAIRDLI